MATKIRPELSKKNKYWIERHRYYELKHFCMQYPIWKKMLTRFIMESVIKSPKNQDIRVQKGDVADPTANTAITRQYYSDRIVMLEQVAKETDAVLGKYVLKGITEGISYDILKVREDIPCCKEVYYDLYRKFFWLLDKERG